VAPTDAIAVAPSNTEQLRAWDGDEGAYWAAHAGHYERSALPFHRRLLAAAEIGPGERVLDVGCGTGQSTLLAARQATGGTVLGVDLSSAMLAHARRRAAAEHLENVRFEQADAQIHPFGAGVFDVIVSSTGATFFGDLVGGFTNLARALRADGRLALVTWQPLADNEWLGELRGAMAAGRDLPAPPPDAPSPFALAEPDRVREVLTGAGFVDVDVAGSHEPMWFGRDADDAYEFVLGQLGWMLADLDAARRTQALDALRGTTAAHETADGVIYDSAVWTVRATRR
jgi:SAM-dependent methyltransferase